MPLRDEKHGMHEHWKPRWMPLHSQASSLHLQMSLLRFSAVRAEVPTVDPGSVFVPFEMQLC